MRRLLRAFALGLVLASSTAGTAHAHQGDPDYRSEVRGILPAVPGLDAEILNYDADMLLSNRSDSTVVVEGYDGEPYLRFSPDGTVAANLHSPAYYLNTDRYGEAEVPDEADPEARPEWKVVAGTGEFQWHDHRSHYMGTSTPPQVGDESVRTKVFDYAIPLRVDGRPAVIEGTLLWVGGDGFPIGPFVGAGVLAVLSVALVIVVRRRRGVASGDAEKPDGDEREAW